MPSVRTSTKASLTAFFLAGFGFTESVWGSELTAGWVVSLAMFALGVSWVCESIERGRDE